MTESPSLGSKCIDTFSNFRKRLDAARRIGRTSSVFKFAAPSLYSSQSIQTETSKRDERRGPNHRNRAKPRAACAIHQLASGVLFAASAGICSRAKSASIRNESSGFSIKSETQRSGNFECSSQRAAKSAMRSMPKSRSSHALTPAMKPWARSWREIARCQSEREKRGREQQSLHVEHRECADREPAKSPGRKSSNRTAPKIDRKAKNLPMT